MAIASVYFITNVYFFLSGIPRKICIWRLPAFVSCKGGVRCKYVVSTL